jgi:hypothetical protein
MLIGGFFDTWSDLGALPTSGNDYVLDLLLAILTNPPQRFHHFSNPIIVSVWTS